MKQRSGLRQSLDNVQEQLEDARYKAQEATEEYQKAFDLHCKALHEKMREAKARVSKGEQAVAYILKLIWAEEK